MRTRDAIEKELRAAEAKIDAAYWRFTRQARAKPCVLAEPQAYEDRKRLRAELAALPREAVAA